MTFRRKIQINLSNCKHAQWNWQFILLSILFSPFERKWFGVNVHTPRLVNYFCNFLRISFNKYDQWISFVFDIYCNADIFIRRHVRLKILKKLKWNLNDMYCDWIEQFLFRLVFIFFSCIMSCSNWKRPESNLTPCHLVSNNNFAELEIKRVAEMAELLKNHRFDYPKDVHVITEIVDKTICENFSSIITYNLSHCWQSWKLVSPWFITWFGFILRHCRPKWLENGSEHRWKHATI